MRISQRAWKLGTNSTHFVSPVRFSLTFSSARMPCNSVVICLKYPMARGDQSLTQSARSQNVSVVANLIWSATPLPTTSAHTTGEDPSAKRSMVRPKHSCRRPSCPNLTHQGEKLRVYSCCSKTTSEDGCSRGFHVFYESDPKVLHLRQPFSFTRPPTSRDGDNSADTALDVVALDCEMIYTTGGMRVARVSVVDGAGTEIFDEQVRMDDGVEVMSVSYSATSLFWPDVFTETTIPDFRASQRRNTKMLP